MIPKGFNSTNWRHNVTRKMSKKNGTKRKIKQNFVRCIVYQQCIIKCCTRKLNKTIEKVFMENWLVRLFRQKMIISEVERLVHYFIKGRWMPIFLVIISKCLEKFLFIVKDHVYIIKCFTQMERNSLRPSLRTIGRLLVWPSPIATRTPFKSTIKW